MMNMVATVVSFSKRRSMSEKQPRWLRVLWRLLLRTTPRTRETRRFAFQKDRFWRYASMQSWSLVELEWINSRKANQIRDDVGAVVAKHCSKLKPVAARFTMLDTVFSLPSVGAEVLSQRRSYRWTPCVQINGKFLHGRSRLLGRCRMHPDEQLPNFLRPAAAFSRNPPELRWRRFFGRWNAGGDQKSLLQEFGRTCPSRDASEVGCQKIL